MTLLAAHYTQIQAKYIESQLSAQSILFYRCGNETNGDTFCRNSQTETLANRHIKCI